jgi:hypothetical protein
MVTEREAKRFLAKARVLVFIRGSQRVFEITPLVPGSPSLDVRSRSPGGTRQMEFSILDLRLPIC